MDITIRHNIFRVMDWLIFLANSESLPFKIVFIQTPSKLRVDLFIPPRNHLLHIQKA